MAESGPELHLVEHRKSFLSLRWLLIILGSYLALFPRIGATNFNVVLGFAILFASTNVAAGLISRDLFAARRVEMAIAAADVLFVAITFFLLQVEETHLHLAFVLVFLLAFF